MEQKLPRVIGLVVMRRLHFTRATVLAQVAGCLVPFFGFWMRQDFLLIRPRLMQGLREDRRWWFGCLFGRAGFHRFIVLV